MKITQKIVISVFSLFGILFAADAVHAMTVDLTWAGTTNGSFEIFASSQNVWDADGPAVCSATLSDTDASQTDCTSGSIADGIIYRVQITLKESTGGDTNASIKDTTTGVVHRNVLAWAGASASVNTTCLFNDFGGDDTPGRTCAAALVDHDSGGSSNDIEMTCSNCGGVNAIVVQNDGGEEGFAYRITTASPPSGTDATSYMIEEYGDTDEQSSLIGITGPAAVTTLTQNDFRFYTDNESENVNDPWGDPNLSDNDTLDAVPRTNNAPTSTSAIRIRTSIAVSGAQLDASMEGFILQFATSTDPALGCNNEQASAFQDVDAAGGTAAWAFTSETGITDNTTLTAVKLGVSDTVGRYSRSNPSTTNPNAVILGNDLEWDWHIVATNAQAARTYCFRMIRDDDPVTELDAYNADSYPRLTTAPDLQNIMRHGNFFDQTGERGLLWTN